MYFAKEGLPVELRSSWQKHTDLHVLRLHLVSKIDFEVESVHRWKLGNILGNRPRDEPGGKTYSRFS